MVSNFENEYFDVLHSIEERVIMVYRDHPDLVDHNVDKVLDGLGRMYTAQQRGRSAPRMRFTRLEQTLADAVQPACELHLGRDPQVPIGDKARTPDEIVACLKRIQRSVKQMGKHGRQGYLDFLREFFKR
jgi:hypothetical protein